MPLRGVTKLIRFKYYILLAIKKPHLIKTFIYKKHLGVILSMPIKKECLDSNRDNDTRMDTEVKISKTNESVVIQEFYQKVNRDSVNKRVIDDWLSKGNECFLMFLDGEPIGGCWFYKGEVSLKKLSEFTISSSKKIMLDDESLYCGNIIMESRHRGKGLYKHLLTYVINYYAKFSNYKNLILVTGASNSAMIATTTKQKGKLIGITQVINVLGFKSRKEFYLNEKLVKWENID